LSLSQPELIVLSGDSTTAILECRTDAAPLWRYWGPRLPDGVEIGPRLETTRQVPSFSLDAPIPFSIFPTFGLGWFGQSALLAHRAGADFAQCFDGCAIEWVEPGKAVRIRLSDQVTGIELCISLALKDDVLILSTTLTNHGETPLDVQSVAAAVLPLPDHAHTVRSFSGRHNAEFVPQCEQLGRAIWRKENRCGLTSHEAFPGAMVEADGVTFGAQLGWSGNHVQTIEWLDDGRYQWLLGEWLSPGEVQLAPGEALTSPDVLATCAPDANGVAANFHAAIRARITWPDGKMKPRPVHLNTWEGYYFDHDLPSLIKLADAAAEVGIERFVLDDGWFNGRDDDTRALGDWWVDARKYPQGLGPLAQHVVSKGMEFGLWVEPEMVNPDSDLFRAHPDWALQLAGRPHQTARNQLVLDLTQQKVSDYLFDQISTLMRTLPISYLKWDHNRDLVAAGDATGRAVYRRQVHAAYALFDRFRTAFPQVEIEACAGGGGRIDAGIIQRTHRFWTSDCIDAVSRARMQPGFLGFMPPEVMGSHIGTAPAHSTGRSQAMDFRAAVALQGHLGVEFDLVKLSEAERARLAEWIAFYKTNRHLLHASVWTGTAGDNLIWHAAGSADEWLLFVYRMAPMELRHMPPVRLTFVNAAASYDVAVTGPDDAGEPSRYGGAWLAQSGLNVPHMKAEEAIIYHGKRV
jgi:alpha-galactosidase